MSSNHVPAIHLFGKTPAGPGINNITAALPTSVLLQPSSMFRFPGLWVASFARITVFSSRIWHFVQQIGVLFCLPQIRAFPFRAVAESAPRGVPALHGFEGACQSSRYLSPLTVDNAT